MDDTQKDGSDSDWDSTLDFTSPRQVGIGKPRIQYEVEDEESALSDESDFDTDQNVPNENPVIKNVLRPATENQDRHSPVPTKNIKENNITLAQKKQNGEQQRSAQQQHTNQPAPRSEAPSTSPPYNFREVIEERMTPEPPRQEPPGKERKGNVYDPAPSPTPRGISKQQGSIRSVGSWDESDADERTLRELRVNYKEQKQKEEQKQREIEEGKSQAEEAPPTARSETTWRSWTGKFGKKAKSKNNQSQASDVTAKQLRQEQQQQQQKQPQPAIQQKPFGVQQPQQYVIQQQQRRLPLQSARPQSSASLSQIQTETRAQTMEVYDPRYETISRPELQVQYVPDPRINVQQQKPLYTREEEEEFEEPKKLIVKDEDRGRYMYFFGHGNLRYFEVNEEFDEAILPEVADKVDRIARRVWQEVFSVLRILLSFFIWFFVELFQFFAKHVLQPFIVGIFMTLGDFVIKPFLSAVFNGFVQPFSIFMWNAFTGMRHMFGPIGEILRKIFEQVSLVLRSIRLFELTWVSNRPDGSHPYVSSVHNV